MELHTQDIPTFAFEGIGGSGKSHVSKKVANMLSNIGYSVLYCKVGGLGDTPRVNRLKKIMSWRHSLLREGKLSSKQMVDLKKEKIFRLASRQQIKAFRRLKEKGYDLAVIDRTPLSIWVYAKASSDLNNPNPFIKEIYEDVTSSAKKLGLSRVYLFNVTPETAYARMIFRYSYGKINFFHLVEDACREIKASFDETELIKKKVTRLNLNGRKLTIKEYESWDLIPIKCTRKEIRQHKKILERCNSIFGLDYTMVDAELSVDSVVNTIFNDITCQLSSSKLNGR